VTRTAPLTRCTADTRISDMVQDFTDPRRLRSKSYGKQEVYNFGEEPMEVFAWTDFLRTAGACKVAFMLSANLSH